MNKIFSRKSPKNEKYAIAFCDENNLTTKFGEDKEIFTTYEDAKHRIFSKANGWGNAIQRIEGDNVKIDNAWLIIEKKT